MGNSEPERFFEDRMINLLTHWGNTVGGMPVWPHPQSTPSHPLDFRVLMQGARTHTVLLVTAGLHGVEGLTGLDLLTRWAARGSALTDARENGISLVVVPCINVWGCQNIRRVDESNVDLNRNFRRWGPETSGTPPDNPGYDTLHSALVPTDWSRDTVAEANARIAQFITTHGMAAYQNALSCGQYTHTDGLFYGGTKPSWSNVTLRRVLQTSLSNAKRIAHIDIHTGLGPWTIGEVLCPAEAEDPMLERAKRWWGDAVRSPFVHNGGSVSAAVTGHMAGAITRLLPHAEVTSMAIEFGTYPIERVVNALRAEQVWHNSGRPSSAFGREVQGELMECFCPNNRQWRDACFDQFMHRVTQALQGLTEE